MKTRVDKQNITTFFFEAVEEDWKGDPNNPAGSGKHRGVCDINRKPKKVMKLLFIFIF
jgi:exo-beta-1,3-glucanase (GH17 family)